jgi:hypothetical protein
MLPSSSVIAVTIRSTTATGATYLGALWTSEEPTKSVDEEDIDKQPSRNRPGAGCWLQHYSSLPGFQQRQRQPGTDPQTAKAITLSALPAHSGCCRVGMVFYGHETLSPGLER